MAHSRIVTKKLRPRIVTIRGQEQRARIPRRPGLDVTLRPTESWPRNAIAAEGELLTLTSYLKDLVRRGDLEVVEDEGDADEGGEDDNSETPESE